MPDQLERINRFELLIYLGGYMIVGFCMRSLLMHVDEREINQILACDV